uniref:Uncharacterized protein n=1 Tax=Zooxanthella nutricula TaxID=1333877 RepID=A0A7S2NJM9_9DINO
MQLFSGRLREYAPVAPLVYAASGCSDTSGKIGASHCETAETLRASAANLLSVWPRGWIRTYCKAPGELHKGPGRESCADDRSLRCCPYYAPPTGEHFDKNVCPG